MAITNGDIYDMILFLVNKSSLSGYLNTTTFNQQLKISNALLLRELLGITNDFQLGMPASRRSKGQSTLVDDQTRPFRKKATVSLSGGIGSLPSDYYRFDSVSVAGALEPCPILFGGELEERISSSIDYPDEEFPVSEIYGSSIQIYPSTITSAVLTYYKIPTSPHMDFYLNSDGEIIYLGVGEQHTLLTGETGSGGETSGTVTSISVESEFDDTAKVDLAFIIARNMGISVQRQDVAQAAEQIKERGI